MRSPALASDGSGVVVRRRGVCATQRAFTPPTIPYPPTSVLTPLPLVYTRPAPGFEPREVAFSKCRPLRPHPKGVWVEGACFALPGATDAHAAAMSHEWHALRVVF